MRTLAGLAAMAALSGCATMNDQQCRAANWAEIGQRDGAAGWTASRLQEHAKACGEYGIVPDGAAYDRGRRQGLVSYCQPTVGRSKGAEGTSYYNVCSGPAEAAFLRGYEVGRQIHGLKKLQEDNRKRRKELTDQLAKKETSADEAKRIKRDLERLDQDDRRLQRLVEQAYQIPL